MTSDDLKNLASYLQQIREQDIAGKIAKQYPNDDLSQKRFAAYSCLEFIDFTSRLIEQFQAELVLPDARHWPRNFRWVSPYHGDSSYDVLNWLSRFQQNIQNSQWDAASQHLEVLIGYQIYCGFWNQGARKFYNPAKLRREEAFSDLEAKSKQIQQLIVEIQALKVECAQDAAKRQTDAQAVANQLTSVQNQAQSVSDLLNKTNGANGQVINILSEQKSNLDKIKADLAEVDQRKMELTNALSGAAKSLAQSEARLKFMEGKKEWVDALAGTAAAGLLGKKFEARMRQLNKSSEVWAKATAWSVVASAVWLYFCHSYLIVKGDSVWATFALNFGLLLPAIFVVGFFAKQFGRVRHFEEEYAFRSAVAMTVSAFADRLNDSPVDRHKLIAETVEKLYRLPALLQEKEPHGWFSRRDSERVIKCATDLVATVKKP